MSFGVDFSGRLRKIRAPLSISLHAVFEAIANSFDATDDLAELGCITVKILLEKDQTLFDSGIPQYKLQGYQIEDNGIGFTDKNMGYFRESDTTNKMGGKGVGRLLWLKVFERAQIVSTYKEADQWWERGFPFSIQKNGVDDKDTKPRALESGQRSTIVQLLSPKKDRVPFLRPDTKIFAAKLLEHFLLYFAVLKGQKVTVVSDIEEPIDVGSLYQDMIGDRHKQEDFEIRGNPFVLHHLFVKPTTTRKNLIRFCARRRVVVSETVSSVIPEVDVARAVTLQGSYRYHAYVTGNYLDEIADDERSDLKFPRNMGEHGEVDDGEDANLPLLVGDDEDVGKVEGVTKEELLASLAEKIRVYLSSHIEDVRKKREKQLEDFAQQEQPQFRPFVAAAKKNLDRLPARPSKKAIEIALYEAKIDGRAELKKTVEEIVNATETWQQVDKQRKFLIGRVVTEANRHSLSALAEYVCTRKAVIDVLKTNLGKNLDAKNQYELPIHDIFFPRSYTSDDLPAGPLDPVDREIENLWLIDERLVFHRLLTSDKHLSVLKKLLVVGGGLVADITKKDDKPDILIFDPALVTAENENFGSLAIIEFKRPGKKEFTLAKNPMQQIIEIAKKIRDGKQVESKTGQVVAINPDVRFYGYIVCDVMEPLRDIIENTHRMKHTPDGIGYYTFHESLNMLIEVIPYSKIISDAERRNAAFFRKLNI